MAINYLLLFVGRWIHRLPWVVRNCTFHLAVVYSSPVWVTQSGVALSHNLVLDLVLVLKSSLKNNFKQGRLSLTAVMQRAYFPAKQRGKFCPPNFLIFCSPEDFSDTFSHRRRCLWTPLIWSHCACPDGLVLEKVIILYISKQRVTNICIQVLNTYEIINWIGFVAYLLFSIIAVLSFIHDLGSFFTLTQGYLPLSWSLSSRTPQGLISCPFSCFFSRSVLGPFLGLESSVLVLVLEPRVSEKRKCKHAKKMSSMANCFKRRTQNKAGTALGPMRVARPAM